METWPRRLPGNSLASNSKRQGPACQRPSSKKGLQMKTFFDSSSLAKRYINETGSQEVDDASRIVH